MGGEVFCESLFCSLLIWFWASQRAAVIALELAFWLSLRAEAERPDLSVPTYFFPQDRRKEKRQKPLSGWWPAGT
jgi:hypothetical protein